MKIKVLLPEKIAAEGIEYLEKRGYEMVYAAHEDSDGQEAIRAAITECQAVIVRNARITRAIMLAAPKLKVIARHGVGVDIIDTAAAAELGIWVTNAPESNTNSVAEQVIGAMLSLARQLNSCHSMVCRGKYGRRTQICGMEMAGKTLGIVGFGRIGRCVAKKAALGLEMNVIVYDPYIKEMPGEYEVKKAESLEEVLREADVVTLHVPLLEDNRHMIGKEQLAVMKKNAILINYARGALVDSGALAEALEQKLIGGAALDVFEKEPVDKDDVLCGLEQVLLTPHTASFTGESLKNMALHAAMGIHEVLAGREPSWCVVAGNR